jgi:histidine ammonia-lyase
MLLKIASLARGFSGVRPEWSTPMLALLNASVYPCIPSKGSVGASGDLAPLAHMSATLLGWGAGAPRGTHAAGGRRAAASPASRLSRSGPRKGSRFSTARRCRRRSRCTALFATENLFAAAVVAGAMSVDCGDGKRRPVRCAHPRAARPPRADRRGPRTYRRLLHGSEITRLAPRGRRQGAGSVQPALPAAR